MERMKGYWSRNQETPRKREERVAKNHKGQRVSGSGSTPWAKEDISTETFLIQHKHTDGKSISVTKKALDELRQNSIDKGKEPLLILEYGREEFFIINRYQFDVFNEAITTEQP